VGCRKENEGRAMERKGGGGYAGRW